ncbi:MAG: hypothetical protein H0T47_19305 [Planctomycetaceae bacterium]|nr:hypothetical protein [Planctomycetaceae bacterium]
MGRSQRLRLRDVRDVFRAVGECRELGSDREAWMRHALAAVRSLTPARVAAVGFQPPAGFQLMRDVRTPVDDGLEGTERAVFVEYHATERYFDDPCFHRYLEIRRPDLTIRTRRLASATEFERSGIWDWARGMGTGDHLFSQRRVLDRRSCLNFSMWTPFRAAPFERRDARLVRLLNMELARLVGPALYDGENPRSALPPRLRKTLERLLLGDSEKQAALALGLSKATVHEYVGLLYRHFDVNSRSELMARCLRLQRIWEPRQ